MTRATKTTRTTPIPKRDVGFMPRVTMGSINEPAPAPANEPEIHRELGNLTNAGRNLSSVVEELYARLQPVLLEHPGDSKEDAVRIRCETNVGLRIREEEAGINMNIGRLRDLIDRLGV